VINRAQAGNAALHLLLGAVVLLGTFTAGYQVASWRLGEQIEAERAKRYAAVAKQVVDSAELAARLDREITAKRERVRTVTRTLIEEVPIYVSEIGNAGCTLPLGFVRLHNLSAAGLPAIPDRADKSNDAPAGVALDYATAVVVENYGTCNDLREQVIGWQAWYTKARAKWEQGAAP
jgi:hypothetical protein